MEQEWLGERSRTLRERLDRRLEEADALRHERFRSRPGQRTRKRGGVRRVGLELPTLKPPDPER
jgi:hypothetical protein